MSYTYNISATIVIYKSNRNLLQKTIDSYLNIPEKKKLYIIDNNETDVLKKQFVHPEIEYIFVGKNIGFGSAHNLVLNKINSNFHLILNPDVVFTTEVISKLIYKLNKSNKVCFVTPKVKYPNGEEQFVCRKHPTFLDLLNRKLKFSPSLISKNQYQDKDLSKAFNPEFIHGCFMLFKTKDFIHLKGFDERYFLYLEDADICRKIENLGKKILYYPNVEIIHYHSKQSAKKIKQFIIHIKSAFKYFLKWGF